MKTQLPYFKSGYLWGLTKNPVSLLDQAVVNLVGLCLSSHSCLIPCPFLSDLTLSSQFPFISYLLMNPHLRVCFWASDLRHTSWLQSFIVYALPMHLPRAWSFRKLNINNSAPINTAWSLKVCSPSLPGGHTDFDLTVFDTGEASWRAEGVVPLPGRQKSLYPRLASTELGLNCYWELMQHYASPYVRAPLLSGKPGIRPMCNESTGLSPYFSPVPCRRDALDILIKTQKFICHYFLCFQKRIERRKVHLFLHRELRDWMTHLSVVKSKLLS